MSAYLILSFLLTAGCAPESGNLNTIKPANSATPIPAPSVIANADYPGKGTVTKIDSKIGSIELDHEEIKGVMAPMRMEFYVSDKSMLSGLKVGDTVDFTLRYKDQQETIVAVTKTK